MVAVAGFSEEGAVAMEAWRCVCLSPSLSSLIMIYNLSTLFEVRASWRFSLRVSQTRMHCRNVRNVELACG